MHWLIHILGIDTQQSWAYDFWSGIATQASLLLAGAAIVRKHNCHHPWCPRISRHTVDGTPWCDHHHQDARKRAQQR